MAEHLDGLGRDRAEGSPEHWHYREVGALAGAASDTSNETMHTQDPSAPARKAHECNPSEHVNT
jgi:hypothetical protein